MNVLMMIEAAVVRSLARDYYDRSVEQAAQQAYVAFAAQHPIWAKSLHDEQFLMRGAQPILEQAVRGEAGGLESARLAQAWADNMWYRNEAMRQRIIDTLLPAADSYLRLFKAKLAALQVDAIALHEPMRTRTVR